MMDQNFKRIWEQIQRKARMDKIKEHWKRIEIVIIFEILSAWQLFNLRFSCFRGTEREYSSTPLKRSIVKRILVFKQ